MKNMHYMTVVSLEKSDEPVLIPIRGKVRAVSFPRFAVDDNEFHFLDIALTALLLLGKQAVMISLNS